MDQISRHFGVPALAIGLTISAYGSSLWAGLAGLGDISLGNVVGSNIFNVLSVLGLSSLVTPLDSGGIGALDLFCLMLTGGLFLPFLAGSKPLGKVGGLVYLLTCGSSLYQR